MNPSRLARLLSVLVLPGCSLQYSLPSGSRIRAPVQGASAPCCDALACAAAAPCLMSVGALSPVLQASTRRHAPVQASLVTGAFVHGPLLAAGVGGTLAGSLHAVTGPDHLAALLPLSIGRRWWTACYTGLYWGMGHGIGAALVGLLAFLVRGALHLETLCTYMEALVGLSILIIGVNGVVEAREWQREADAAASLVHAKAAMVDGTGVAIDGSAAVPRTPIDEDPKFQTVPAYGLVSALSQAPKRQTVASTLLTGILHGCSGSGHLLGVMPALAMPSMTCALTYLSAFGFGTMLAMSSFTGIVGELSVQMGERLQQPDVPAKLALGTSLFACVMGIAWTAKALIELRVPGMAVGLFRRVLAARA